MGLLVGLFIGFLMGVEVRPRVGFLGHSIRFFVWLPMGLAVGLALDGNDVVVMQQNGFVTKFPKKLCRTTILILSYLSHVMMVCCILHIYLAHLILDSGINTLYVLYMHSYVLFIYIFLMTTNQSHLTLELWLELQQPDNCNNGFYQLPAFAGYWPKEDYACSSLTPIPSNASICLDYLFLSSSTGIWLVNLLSLSYYFWISLVWNKL